MRIEVLGEETISAQARTYAEYRLFAALSQNVDTNRVKHARLTLQRTKPNRVCDSVSCTVTVDFEDSNPLRIQAAGDHPYAAINRAVERLSEGCWRRRPSTDDYSLVAQAAKA
jgi:ribosome-associated translation inhibitor RaiA